MQDRDRSAVLDAPVKDQVPRASGPRRAPGQPPVSRRDPVDDYARRSRVAAASQSAREDDDSRRQDPPRRFSGLRFRLQGGMPRSWTGRIFAGALVLASLAGVSAVLLEARSLLLHDPRLVLASSSAIELTGNQHITRAQLLSIFGGDVERNILTVPLADRRAQFEALPWVEHATVMRLLPDHIRVALVERTPVAFVRQGSHIGLVDSNGVLLDMAPNATADDHYSFPVVTGLNPDDPLSTRAARMQIFERFTRDLDSEGQAISKTLSEVDLTSPEDVKALVPTGSSDILVHFGQDDFLARYKRLQANLPGWKSEYPKLASVDLRYDRQVVLQMSKGEPAAPSGAKPEVPAAAAEKPEPQAKLASAPRQGKAVAKPSKRPVRVPEKATKTHKVPAKATAKPAARNSAPTAQEPAWEQRLNGTHAQHLERSFAVGAGAAHSISQGPQ